MMTGSAFHGNSIPINSGSFQAQEFGNVLIPDLLDGRIHIFQILPLLQYLFLLESAGLLIRWETFGNAILLLPPPVEITGFYGFKEFEYGGHYTRILESFIF